MLCHDPHKHPGGNSVCLVLVTFKAPVMEDILFTFLDLACADFCHLLGESSMWQQKGRDSPGAGVELRMCSGSELQYVWEAEHITVSILTELLGEVGSRVRKVGSSNP